MEEKVRCRVELRWREAAGRIVVVVSLPPHPCPCPCPSKHMPMPIHAQKLSSWMPETSSSEPCLTLSTKAMKQLRCRGC